MKMTGHKTRAVFDRYHIVSPVDLQEAARRLAMQAEPRSDATQRAGTFPGTPAVSPVDRVAQPRENRRTGG
ncbi:MAG: hypothetical protein HYU41_03980 [Candidatus Rokubacteria bacterium]|nr:hypothetical protein [Candidatus Rokubacteria bacterium]